MSGLADVAAVAGGLALGGLSGYAVGRGVVASRRAFWWAAGSGIVACVAVDILGLVLGANWLMVGSLGVMAGWLTGLKYGGIAEVRVWERPATAAEPEPEPTGGAGADASPDAAAPASEDAGADGTSPTVTG